MNNKRRTLTLFTISIISVLIIDSCKKEKAETDNELFNMAKETSGFVWFKNSSALLNKSSGSGHSQPFLRTRYNSIAASKLDTNEKVMPGATFHEGSVIVKELHDNSTTIGRYAILYKKSDHDYADAKGWVWGYVNADGSVVTPASKKGESCINCHSQADNIDYMLMNKYFP